MSLFFFQVHLRLFVWCDKVLEGVRHFRMLDDKVDGRCFILGDHQPFSFMNLNLNIPEYVGGIGPQRVAGMCLGKLLCGF